MKKKILNNCMTIISVIYLFSFMVLLIANWISKGNFSWLEGDILLILGAISSLLEILISNRNFISKKINQLIFSNKATNYKILVSFCDCELSLEEIITSLEKSLCDGLGCSELTRKPISKYQRAKWNVFYEGINCQVSCYNDYFEEEKSKNYSLEIAATSKYGKINSKRKNVLYFATLVKILGNYFFVMPQIISKCKVGKIEVIVNWYGSELEPFELFSDKLKNVDDYWIKTLDGVREDEEIFINKSEIRWSTLDSRTLIDGFDNFTNIMSSII